GIARRHGAAVDKYLGDSLMAVYGHPVPLPCPAAAAVTAALEMQRRLREYDAELALPVRLELQVGIATGPLVAGVVGDQVVREFHVLGDTVNVAARLRAKAPRNGVRVDETTAAESVDECTFGPPLSLVLKGKARPVLARDARGLCSRRTERSLVGANVLRTPLVGRDAELARLRAAAARAAAGRGGVVLVTGPEGIGRSRLLAELEEAPERKPFDVVVVRAGPDDGAPGASAAALLGELSQEGVAAPVAAGAIPDALAAAVAVRRRPLLIALENLERFDAASLAAFAALLPLASRRPLLLVVTAEPMANGAAGELLALTRALGAACEEIALGPLAAAAAARLLDALAGDAAPDEAARALLLDRAAGHPGRLALGVHLAPAPAAERAPAARRAGRGADAEPRRATILFADITGFTAMTERLGAEAAYPIVARCLALLDDVARRHGGHVEKHLGDCVMATFGVPEAIEDAPRAALNAAIEMRTRL